MSSFAILQRQFQFLSTQPPRPGCSNVGQRYPLIWKLKFSLSTGQRSIDWSSIIHLLDTWVKQESMNSLLRQIIRETSIFILPMKWVHLVERDEEAILYPESLGFLVSGIDEEGESGSFSGSRLSSFWIRQGRLCSGSCILLLHL